VWGSLATKESDLTNETAYAKSHRRPTNLALHPLPRRSLPSEIARLLRIQIGAGELITGGRLPPLRQMAADLGVSPTSLRRALGELVDEGLIEIRHGRGTFVKPSR
jgi:DNA-binding FadR family transcriptional regulator